MAKLAPAPGVPRRRGAGAAQRSLPGLVFHATVTFEM
jgi:hypothetical protein